MKKLIFKTIEMLTGATVHANHTSIKGKKSGGARDSNGVDWKLTQPLPGQPSDSVQY